MASPDAAPASEIYPEDRELIETLAKIQNMHNQVHNLRGLLPGRLLKPTQAALQSPSKISPAKLAADLRETAIQGSQDIRRFSSDFRSEPMQKLWQTTSSSEIPQGRDAWTVDYEMLLKSSPSSTTQNLSASAGADAAAEPEDVSSVINKFKEANPLVGVVSVTPPATFPLHVTVDSLRFRVTNEAREGRQSLLVSKQPDDSSALTQSVVDNINKREQHPNLEVLLSMLVSYKDLRFTPCSQCKSHYDTSQTPWTFPVVRKRIAPVDKEDTSIRWAPLHERCAS